MSEDKFTFEKKCLEIETAIAAQEAQRSILGNSVVDVTIKALQEQLTTLKQSRSINDSNFSTSELREKILSHIPEKLANKLDEIGHIKEEKRQVTVLFADLVGFTSLCESFDQEFISSLTSEVLKELSEAVYKYEGYVDKFLGDAIMAVFGAPLTHEDDPERALHAALEMRNRVEALDRKWCKKIGRPLEIHIGINTGEVIAGYSDYQMSYSVIGDTVNTASRLESASKPGQILVSGNTYRLTRESFSFIAMEPIRAKGKSKPLAVYGLLRAKMLPRKARGLTDLASVFVGREREIEKLEHVSDSLQSGNGSIVALNGEGGIGKSRLMVEWKKQLDKESIINWLEGRCLPFTSSIAYSPFLELLRRYAAIDEEQTEEAARRRLDLAVNRFFPDDKLATVIFANLMAMDLSDEDKKILEEISAVKLHDYIFSYIEKIFTILADDCPTILLIEDLHWVDTSSLELLEHLAKLTKHSPFIIVILFRPEDTITRWVNNFNKQYEPSFTAISLTPLNKENSFLMLSKLLSKEDFPADLSKMIVTKAEGNPFYVEEIIRTLIEQNVLEQDDTGQWLVLQSVENINVPDTLHGLLMARLDRLPQKTKFLAQQAAVIGRIFLLRILTYMTEQDGEIDKALDRMEREDLIRERARDPELEYMFRHALTQEVAYESLLSGSRKELHRKVGDAMEHIFKDRIGEFAGIIGEHFYKGEAWEKSADYLIRSGDAFARIYANTEARKYYAQALKALEKSPGTTENKRRIVDVTIKFAKAAYFGIPPEQILQRLEAAVEINNSIPGPDGEVGSDILRLARLNLQIGLAHVSTNRMKEAIEYYKKVLEVAPKLGDPELLGVPSFAIGNALVFQGYLGKAKGLLSQSMPALEKTENWFAFGRAKAMRSWTLTMMGDCYEAQREAEEALELGKKINASNVIVAANLMLTAAYGYADRTKKSIEYVFETGQRAVDAAEQSEDMLMTYVATGVQAWNYTTFGKLEEATLTMNKCMELAKNMGGQLFMVDHFTSRRALISLKLHQFEEAKNLARQAIEVAQKVGGLWAEAHARRILAIAIGSLDLSQTEMAEKELAKSLELYETSQNFMGVAHTNIAWGSYLAEHGQQDVAKNYWQRAIDFFESKGLEKRSEEVQKIMGS